ncbi:MAG: nitroreductase family deazaflavin-dependent oxidoreductase [Deltaproteobacteria bacterium]|nr:nitroreductase family deazaflavin-dependent oxidoreductase [Deltaproteobacteria bacterium]
MRSRLAATLLLLAACATVPVVEQPASALDWDAVANVEVIQILTSDADGDTRVTPVWFVRVAGATYLRTSGSRWLANLQRDPDVTVRVESVDHPQRAQVVEDPRIVDAVENASREKYGFQNTLVRLVRTGSIDVIRLDPR